MKQAPPLPVSVELARGSTPSAELENAIRERLRDVLVVQTRVELVPWGSPAAERVQVDAGRAPMSASLLTTVVGSYPQPEWLIDRRVSMIDCRRACGARELWRVPEPFLEEAQNDATRLAVQDMERAGVDVITDGEMRRESYSNRFATALDGIDLDEPGTRSHGSSESRAARRRSGGRVRSRCRTSSSCARSRTAGSRSRFRARSR